MTLDPGSRLGTYEIMALIGVGGMGEVYKARDPKLNRLVAIKVLPVALAADPSLLARFDREAKAVAALSHPNVLGIFDLATQDGITYAVMELLEGENLRDRCQHGALPLTRALEIAIEVALGLAAAHERGIVHRDVKPENIFITADGRVKLLDFGLAKQVAGPKGAQENLDTEAVALQPQATEAGMVMGTAAYMSPEQAKGDPADARSDIFSFGVVLYEMLSGRRPFQGKTAYHTMAAILDQDPPALVAGRGALPPALERLVLHCLEKNPAARFQSMKDVAYDLQNLGLASTLQGAGGTFPKPGRAWLLPSALTAAVLLALLGLAALSNLLHLGRATAMPTFTRLGHIPGTVETAFFGPDGRTVYFSERIQGGMPKLFVLHPGSAEPSPLGVTHALLLGVAATGDLAILKEPVPYIGTLFRGTLARVGSEGGAVREVRREVVTAAWDGAGFITLRDVEMDALRLEWAGRLLEEISPFRGFVRMLRPAPDGRTLAAVHTNNDSGRTQIVTFDRQGRRAVWFTKDGDAAGDLVTGLAWGPAGDLWFSEVLGDQTALWSLAKGGSRRLLWKSEGVKALMDVARDGRCLLVDQQLRRGVLVQKASEGAALDISILNGTQAMGFSADGRALVLLESPLMDGGTPGDKVHLWTAGGGPAARLCPGNVFAIAPDGQWVNADPSVLALKDLDPALAAAFTEAGLDPKTALSPDPPCGFLVFIPTGAGLPRVVPLPKGVTKANYCGTGPDARPLVFNAEENGKNRWFALDRVGGPLRALSPPGFNLYQSQTPLSPDAARLIVGRNGQFFVQDLSGGPPRPIPGLVGDERPIGWTKEPGAIYVRTRALPMRVDRLELATGQRRTVYTYSPGDASGLMQIHNVYLPPDGHLFALSYNRELSSLYLVEGLR